MYTITDNGDTITIKVSVPKNVNPEEVPIVVLDNHIIIIGGPSIGFRETIILPIPFNLVSVLTLKDDINGNNNEIVITGEKIAEPVQLVHIQPEPEETGYVEVVDPVETLVSSIPNVDDLYPPDGPLLLVDLFSPTILSPDSKPMTSTEENPEEIEYTTRKLLDIIWKTPLTPRIQGEIGRYIGEKYNGSVTDLVKRWYNEILELRESSFSSEELSELEDIADCDCINYMSIGMYVRQGSEIRYVDIFSRRDNVNQEIIRRVVEIAKRNKTPIIADTFQSVEILVTQNDEPNCGEDSFIVLSPSRPDLHTCNDLRSILFSSSLLLYKDKGKAEEYTSSVIGQLRASKHGLVSYSRVKDRLYPLAIIPIRRDEIDDTVDYTLTSEIFRLIRRIRIRGMDMIPDARKHTDKLVSNGVYIYSQNTNSEIHLANIVSRFRPLGEDVKNRIITLVNLLSENTTVLNSVHQNVDLLAEKYADNIKGYSQPDIIMRKVIDMLTQEVLELV